MEWLLDFMYRGSIDVTEEHLPSLIKVATELEIRGLSADHQSDSIDPFSNIQRNYPKVNLGSSNPGDPPSITPSKLQSINSSHNIVGIDDVEVEDDPMIMDTQGNHHFDDSSTSIGKYIRRFPPTSCRRETRFKGKKRVSVGRVTRSTDGIHLNDKSQCPNPVIPPLRGMNLDFTAQKIRDDHENSQHHEVTESVSSKDDDLKAVNKKRSDDLKQGIFKESTIIKSSEADKKPHKPYSCDLCTLAFTRASHLARHRRVHTGERPFACTLCPRMFARQDKLKQHLDSHMQWHRKKALNNETSNKLIPIKMKRGRPRKITKEQSAYDELMKFGEFSSMLNKSQSLNMKNHNTSSSSEQIGNSAVVEQQVTTA